MSEVPPSICPKYCRPLPKQAANDEINKIFRTALHTAVSSEKSKKHATRDQYVDAVAYKFYQLLGAGALEARIEVIASNLPPQFIAHTPRKNTVLKCVDRVDFRSYAHTAVMSGVIALTGKDPAIKYYVGTDKLGHFVQQGYDYWIIYKAIEARDKGLGELFAAAWGYWSEGEKLSDEWFQNYLVSRNLPAHENRVKSLKKTIDNFLKKSEIVEILSPTPEGVKVVTPLRKLAHFIGTHQFGILGGGSTGIISYADIAANDAGLRFYLDLAKDPDSLAQNFDIKDYVSCVWDEEILKSKYLPVIERRIDEALGKKRKSLFVYGMGAQYDAFANQLGLSIPVLYYSAQNYEIRWRLGMSVPLTSQNSALSKNTDAFTSLDLSVRLSGLHYAHLSTTVGATSQIFSDAASDGVRPSFQIGYEVMLFGWASFQVGYIFHAWDRSSSIGIGTLLLWR